MKDRIEMDACAIHVGERSVGFIENQREVRAGQNDRIDGIPLDELFGELRQALTFGLSAGARRCPTAAAAPSG